MMRRGLAIVVVLWLCSWTAWVAAEEPTDHFAEGTAALKQGRFDEAIQQLEAYADREPSHPDVSFNRGLAYLMRVRAGAERPGDLGRAAAAFAETLEMRPGDEAAEHALELVHGEVARRRSRRGQDALLERPTLDRVVVGLAGERAWGFAALASSWLLAIGLLLRRRREGAIHLAGVLLTPACAVGVLLFTPLYLGARHLRLNTSLGVLVVREAHLSDEQGVAKSQQVVPEAALLEVGERRGRLIEVRYGSIEGWVPAGAVRLLHTR